MLNAAMMSSAKGDWFTPEIVLYLVRELGPIALDPCTAPFNPTRARSYVTREHDGLRDECDWVALARMDTVGDGGTLIYVNPPYGRGIERWLARCADAGAAGAELIALVPARTDAKWWQSHVTTADVVCFWRGRLRFVGAPSSAPFPSALAYWGPRVEKFAHVFEAYGWIARTRLSSLEEVF